MVIPKGNPLFEDVEMNYTDTNIMVNNLLQQSSFNGYLVMELPTKTTGLLFFSNLFTSVVAAELLKDSSIIPSIPGRILSRFRERTSNISCYALSDTLLRVISNVYMFKQIHDNLKVKKKDFYKIIKDLEADEITGYSEIRLRDKSNFIFLDKGKLLVENLLENFGDIVCGEDAINKKLNEIEKEGATVNIYGEKNSEIDNKKQKIKEELDLWQELTVSQETGLLRTLGSEKIAKIDDNLYRTWEQSLGEALKSIEVETSNGETAEVKVGSRKGWASKIILPNTVMTKLSIRIDEKIFVKPVLTRR